MEKLDPKVSSSNTGYNCPFIALYW